MKTVTEAGWNLWGAEHAESLTYYRSSEDTVDYYIDLLCDSNNIEDRYVMRIKDYIFVIGVDYNDDENGVEKPFVINVVDPE